MSDSGAPASTRAAETISVRGVAFGMGERRRVHHDAGHQVGRQCSVAGRKVDPEPTGQQRHHLAGRGRGRIDPVRVARGLVRGVVIDEDPRQPLEQLGVARPDLADPLQRSAVEDDQQVVARRRVRIGPEALRPGHEPVERRDRIGAHQVGRSAVGFDHGRDAECRPERVGVGVLVAHRQDASRRARRSTTRSGTAARYGNRSTVTAAVAAAVAVGPGRAAPAPRCARTGGRTADGGSSARSPSCGSRATGVGSDSPRGVVRVRRLPGLQVAQQAEDAGAALGRVVELDVEIGDALDPQARAQLVAHERHRPAQGGQRGIALGRLADDAHPDLGVAKIRRGLDRRDRREPDPRIGHVAGHDRADLLPQQLVDPLGPLAHR